MKEQCAKMDFHKKLRNCCILFRFVIEYSQIERQIHIGFTDDVLLVMQARSDGNDHEEIRRISLGVYSFLSGLFFIQSCIPAFQSASRPGVETACKEIPAVEEADASSAAGKRRRDKLWITTKLPRTLSIMWAEKQT